MDINKKKITGLGNLIFFIIGIVAICYLVLITLRSPLTSTSTPTPDIVYAKELIEITKENWHCYRDPNNGDMVFEGTVKSTSDKTLYGVELRGTIYNSAGQKVSSDTGNANVDGTVLGTESATFRFYVRDQYRNTVDCKLIVEGARFPNK